MDCWSGRHHADWYDYGLGNLIEATQGASEPYIVLNMFARSDINGSWYAYDAGDTYLRATSSIQPLAGLGRRLNLSLRKSGLGLVNPPRALDEFIDGLEGLAGRGRDPFGDPAAMMLADRPGLTHEQGKCFGNEGATGGR